MGSRALVKIEVRDKTKCSDEKGQRDPKRCISFLIALVKKKQPGLDLFILNLTADEIKYVMAEILMHKV